MCKGEIHEDVFSFTVCDKKESGHTDYFFLLQDVLLVGFIMHQGVFEIIVLHTITIADMF